jgi:hypothetical protein
MGRPLASTPTGKVRVGLPLMLNGIVKRASAIDESTASAGICETSATAMARMFTFEPIDDDHVDCFNIGVSASTNVRCASIRCSRSTILPSSRNAPLSLFSGCAKASTIR